MKKVFKLGSLILIGVLSLLFNYNDVNAASATISVNSSSTKVVVGKTFKITVKISSSIALGSWDYTLNYDSNYVSLVSSDVPLRYAFVGDGKAKSKSYSYTFKSLKSGTAKFFVSKSSVLDWDFNKLSVTNGTRNVTLITQAQLEASYSKNNDLSSLSIDGYELSPAFDKDTIAYSVNIPSTVTAIKINAKKADSTASVAGVGEFPVSEGLNTFEIKVTAQNGNVKTYTLNVNVEDMNPILVTIDGQEYTVIKRKDLLTSPATFQETTVTINETEIPAFTSEVLKYNLVGLKDTEGNIKLYIYNEGTYTPYVELSLNNVILNPIKYNKEIKGYEKTTILINSVETEVYKLNSKSDFAVVYGKNVESGEEGLYLFDVKENTLQRFYTDEVVKLKKEIKEYTIILFALAGALTLSIGYIAFTIIKKVNKKDEKPNKKVKKQKEEEKIEE